jgi:hypothetical protein
MAQPAQGFALNLPDALASQPKLLPNFFERIRAFLIQSKTHP